MKKQSIIFGNKAIFCSLLTLCFTGILIVTLVAAYIGSSLGWFAKNTSVQANGMQVAVKTDESLKAYVRFFDVLSINESADTVTFDFNNPKSNSATLPKYDTINKATHYILMEIVAERDCVLTISTDTTYVLDKSRPLLSGNGEGEAYSNWLSSIAFFEEVEVTDNAVTISDKRDTFVNKDDYTFSFDKEAPFTYNIQGTEIADDGTATNHPFYLVIGYDSDLVNRLFSENIGNDATTGEINYIGDIDFAISLGGNT